MMKLGELTENARHSEQSREVMHRKIDDLGEFQLSQVQTMAELGEQLKTVTAVASQARDVAESGLKNMHRFETEFREVQLPIITAASAFKIEAEPVLETMKVVRNIAMTLLGMGVFSIAGVAAAALWAREYLAIGLRFLLGL